MRNRDKLLTCNKCFQVLSMRPTCSQCISKIRQEQLLTKRPLGWLRERKPQHEARERAILRHMDRQR